MFTNWCRKCIHHTCKNKMERTHLVLQLCLKINQIIFRRSKFFGSHKNWINIRVYELFKKFVFLTFGCFWSTIFHLIISKFSFSKCPESCQNETYGAYVLKDCVDKARRYSEPKMIHSSFLEHLNSKTMAFKTILAYIYELKYKKIITKFGLILVSITAKI